MSADNWATCPRCFEDAQKAYIAKVDALHADYGKVPAQEYVTRMETLILPEDSNRDFVTFREDYEFYGAEDGVVTATYSGHCSVCQLSCNFEIKKEFYPNNEC